MKFHFGDFTCKLKLLFIYGLGILPGIQELLKGIGMPYLGGPSLVVALTVDAHVNRYLNM